jgi:hypothetical protein
MGQMNREIARQVIDEVKVALAPLCAKHQLRLARDTARFDHASLRLTLELNCEGDAGEDLRDRATWEMFATAFGVKPEDFGKVISSGLHRYKLVELNPGRSKYPFTGEDLDNHKRYKLTALDVQLGLQKLAETPRPVEVTPVHVVVKPPQGESLTDRKER